MTAKGFDAPADAAAEGYPPGQCRVVSTRVNDDHAYVLLETGTATQKYLYGVNFKRVDGRWFEVSSANTPGWEQTDPDLHVGNLSIWGEAPRHADAVRAVFTDVVVEEPVRDATYLIVRWGVPEQLAWAGRLEFRIDGRWSRIGPDAIS
jgi:hypothetical protein